MTNKTENKKTPKPAKKVRKKKSEDAFLFKRGNEFYLLHSSALNSLSIEELYRLGMTTYVEQRKQLLLDAITGDHYVNSTKIVDGLENSLRKLEEKIPNLVAQIDQMDLRANGSIKYSKC